MQKRRANTLILAGLLSFFLIITGLTYGAGVSIPCPFKSLTGIPCPGCGGMRVLDALLHGQIYRALTINPLSVLLIAATGITAVWIVVDLIRGDSSCTRFLRRLDRPAIAWTVAAVIIIAWARNIAAGI